MADPDNSVTLASGSQVIVGVGTQFIAAEGDVFYAAGASGVIESRVSALELRLKKPWGGPPVIASLLWDVSNVGPYWQSSVSTNLLLTTLLKKFEAGPLKFDASGSIEERDNYDDQPKDFTYLSVNPLPFKYYVKQADDANGNAVWSVGQALGSAGGQVEFEEALEQERQNRIQSEAAINNRVAGIEGFATSFPNVVTILQATDAEEARQRTASDVAQVNATQALAGRVGPLETFQSGATQALATLNSTLQEEIRQRGLGDAAGVTANNVVSNRVTAVESRTATLESSVTQNTTYVTELRNRATNLEAFQDGATQALAILSATDTEEARQRTAADTAQVNRSNQIENDLTTTRNRVSNLETFQDGATQALSLNTQTLQSEISIRTQETGYLTTESQKTNARATTLEAKTNDRGYRYRPTNARPVVLTRDVYDPASGGWGIYTFGLRMRKDVKALGQLTVYPADFNAAVVLNVSAYIRTNEDSIAQGGQDPTDTLLLTVPFLLTPNPAGLNLISGSEDLVGSPTQRFLWQAVKLDLGGVGPILKDTLVVFKVEAIGGDGMARVPIGWAKGYDTLAGTKGIYKGLRAAPATPNNAQRLENETKTIPFALSERYGSARVSGRGAAPYRPQASASDAASTSWAANTVTIPEIVIEKAGAPLVIDSAQIAFALPKQEPYTSRVTLQWSYSWNLYHQDIANVTVTRVSDGVRLDAGVDYVIDYDNGAIIGLKNVPITTVDVLYLADYQRFDLVYADPNVGGAAIIAGADRGGDVNEYQPPVPLGAIPLFRAFVTRSRGVELIPLYNWDGFALRGEEATHHLWLEYCRKALSKVWRQIGYGSLRICGYGDSITAQGTGFPTTASPNAFYVPNGDSRDNRDYVLTFRYPTATLDTIAPLTDGHTRLGWNWFLIDAIEKAAGFRPEYFNLGIGGTHSGTGTGIRAGVPDGTYPDRLQAVVNCQPHVVVLGFGMGQIGLDFTYSSVRSIINFFDYYGIETIVMGTPLPNKRGFRTAPLDDWRTTNDDLARAARDMGKAFIPTHRWADPRNLGAFGFAYDNASEANCLNHPGPAELARYGAMLAQIVPPNLGTRAGLISLPRDPLPSDLLINTVADVKNTSTGRISRWVNDGGQIKDLGMIVV